MPITPLEGKDPLSGALKPVSVLGKLYCFSEFSAPWAVSFSKKKEALFHIILKGKCFLMHSEEKNPVALDQGDLLVFPKGVPHVLSDTREGLSVSFLKLVQGLKGPIPVVRHGGGGKKTKIVCGTFEIETGEESPLLQVLPEVMHINASSLSARWLNGTVELLTHEARNFGNGSALIVSGLINLLLVQAVRLWIDNQPEGNGTGFLGALQDRRIAAAIAAIHSQPEKEWSVESLAKIAGMSRSSFSAYFSSNIGQPPLSYVTNWRMQVAAQVLRKNTKMSLSRVSEEVGYFSQHAFSKAFKRYHGISPSEFRMQHSS
ncbi:MAG TPA: AraC family transcriptional regulator [Acidobacteriota bacterium]|nr:AraC family transcriptional regulator [Acidobacteriota bacterium]